MDSVRWGWWLVVREHGAWAHWPPEHHRHAVNLACFTSCAFCQDGEELCVETSKGVPGCASRQAGCSQITLHSMAACGRGQAAGHSPQAERKDTPQLLQHHGPCNTATGTELEGASPRSPSHTGFIMSSKPGPFHMSCYQICISALLVLD